MRVPKNGFGIGVRGDDTFVIINADHPGTPVVATVTGRHQAEWVRDALAAYQSPPTDEEPW